jgi:hypothetical protein
LINVRQFIKSFNIAVFIKLVNCICAEFNITLSIVIVCPKPVVGNQFAVFIFRASLPPILSISVRRSA